MNEGITRCLPVAISAHIRSVVRAALAAIVLILATIGFTATAPARAAVAGDATPQVATAATYASAAARLRLRVWRYAIRQRGKPYIWGGAGPRGFDCSGLVYAAYRASGVRLPRTTYGMLASWRLVRIPKYRARRGDLAFFGPGHVELYVWGAWTYGATDYGSRVGFHKMNAFWHPTMYFRVRL